MISGREEEIEHYTLKMALRSIDYDLTYPDIEKIMNGLDGYCDLMDYQKSVLEDANLLVSKCSGCENDKLFDDKRKIYYCPLCDY